MVETYISLALKKTIDENVGHELDGTELEGFIDMVIRAYFEEAE